MKSKRIIRLMKLLQMLQAGRGKNPDGLAKVCGVGKRTIFRDLETLRKAGVKLAFDTHTKRYSIPSGSFGPPSDLTAEEALSLWALANALGNHPQFPFYDAARTGLAKLAKQLPVGVRRKFHRLNKSISFRPLKLSNVAGKLTSYYAILDAIDRRRAIALVYSSLTEWETIKTTLHPYTIMFYNHTWYVVGHSSMHREVRTFNLVRIESLKTLSKRFSIPSTFNLEAHIGNAWSIIPSPGRDDRVVVKFGSNVAENVAQVKWHKSQRTDFHPDGSLTFKATIAGFHEIEWWILGYGDQAEVKSPVQLRRKIALRTRNMARMYARDIEELAVNLESPKKNKQRSIR
jgi:predicted DNA-binding transcriptional regulator YafY